MIVDFRFYHLYSLGIIKTRYKISPFYFFYLMQKLHLTLVDFSCYTYIYKDLFYKEEERKIKSLDVAK